MLLEYTCNGKLVAIQKKFQTFFVNGRQFVSLKCPMCNQTHKVFDYLGILDQDQIDQLKVLPEFSYTGTLQSDGRYIVNGSLYAMFYSLPCAKVVLSKRGYFDKCTIKYALNSFKLINNRGEVLAEFYCNFSFSKEIIL